MSRSNTFIVRYRPSIQSPNALFKSNSCRSKQSKKQSSHTKISPRHNMFNGASRFSNKRRVQERFDSHCCIHIGAKESRNTSRFPSSPNRSFQSKHARILHALVRLTQEYTGDCFAHTKKSHKKFEPRELQHIVDWL